jgi:DNA-binding CsgD family transcriptional regulator
VIPQDCPLTPRQWDVLLLLSQGWSYLQIGRELSIGASTARGHAFGGCRRLGVARTGAAITLMARRGWLGWEPPRAALRHVVAGYLDALDRYAAGEPGARTAMMFYADEMRRIIKPDRKGNYHDNA